MNTSKKLPCGHIFHTACLRSWFQRQQTCPTCRLNILRNTTTQPDRAAGEINMNNNANANINAHPANINTANVNIPNTQNANVPQDCRFCHHHWENALVFDKSSFTYVFPVTNPFANLFNPQQNNNTNVQTIFGSNFSFNPYLFPSVIPPPPIPPTDFFFPPLPNIPDGLGELSVEELYALEGTERRNVEERIKVSLGRNRSLIE